MTGNGSTAWICTCIRDDRRPDAVAVPDSECPRHGVWGGVDASRLLTGPRRIPAPRGAHKA